MKPEIRHKLEDVAILMILKIDSQDRLVNLELTLQFLQSHFDVDIFLLEVGERSILQFAPDGSPRINHEFVQTVDETFHMTRYRNYLVSKTTAQILIHYDVDVIVNPQSIIEVTENIRSGAIDIGYPYDGRFYNLTPTFKNIYYKTRSFRFLNEYQECFQLAFEHSLGGIFICDRNFYNKIGCENEKIIGWGPDDKDRFYKSIKAGGRYRRTPTPLYHLFHPITATSLPGNNAVFINNLKEYILNL